MLGSDSVVQVEFFYIYESLQLVMLYFNSELRPEGF